MAAFTRFVSAMAAMYPLLASPALAGSIADIEHVILFMQENRAFDHYFGTMAGVRGFSDPNVQVNLEGPIWQQAVDASLTNSSASYLLPWYLNYQGGDAFEATQCMEAGDNGWSSNHAALNGGLNNHWATNNTPWSWGHFQRSDIPVQFAIAEGWTVGDMYQEAVIAATNPNRVTWASGSINVPGSPQNASQGGYPYIDNNETPGCEVDAESDDFNCYPLLWKTTAEIYEDAGVSWSVYQDADNFDDNPLAWFGQFQDALAGSDLSTKGIVGGSLDDFYAQAANGNLPAISYIIGPSELSEHQPYAPRDGAWLQKQIVDAVTQGAGYNKTALIISYDESGGWGDHVTPYHSPDGTAGEWLEDPYGEVGYTYSGPGFRLPFYIVSPWTRNGNVFTEHADHNSQIMFVEEWLAAKNKSVVTDQMAPWRRQHMSNLVNAFDFDNPDYSLPALPVAPEPHMDSTGAYDGAAYCESLYAVQRPDVPYTAQIAVDDVPSLSEEGFKSMRGALTEGRYIVLELNGYALTNEANKSIVTGTASTSSHSSLSQRWIVHSLVNGGETFTINSAVDGRYIATGAQLVGDSTSAETYTVSFNAGAGYALRQTDGNYVAVGKNGTVQSTAHASYFQAFSVTYSL